MEVNVLVKNMSGRSLDWSATVYHQTTAPSNTARYIKKSFLIPVPESSPTQNQN